MLKMKLLKTIRIKSIFAGSFLFLLNLSFTGANASCLQLCSENWWLNTSREEIKSEISKVKNLNMRDDYGFRPLHFAVQNGEKDKVNLLLKRGANANAKTDHGFTPIYFSVGKNGDLEILKMLIKFGALVNVNDKNGITPLHYAAWGTAEKISILLEAGADKKAKTNSGKTAFELAKDNEDLFGTETYYLLENTNE